MELPQEAVGQLGPLVEEALLQRGEGFVTQRPKQSLLAEERVIAEQAVQGRVLGRHVSFRGQFLTKKIFRRQPNERCVS